MNVSGSERAVIAAIIRTDSEDRLHVASEIGQIITPADFTDDFFREAYKVVAELVNAGRAPTITAMREMLTASLKKFTPPQGHTAATMAQQTLAVIAAESIECKRNYVLHAEQIAETAALYRAAETAERYAAVLKLHLDGNAPESLKAADTIAAFQQETMGLPLPGSSLRKKPTLLRDILPAHWEKMRDGYEEQTGDGLQWMDTGYSTLSRYTRGFGPGQLIMLAAQSGKGKSSLAINLARNLSICNNNAVGHFFSLEMMQYELMERFMYSTAHVRQDMYTAKNIADIEWGKLSAAFRELCDLPIHLHDDEDVTVDGIAAYCRAERFKDNCDFVIVDYTQILTPSRLGRPGTRTEEVEQIVAGLKRMAKSLGVPVIALSQLNDNGDVKQSRKIKEDASVLLILQRQQEPKDVTNANEVGLYYNLSVNKCRHGIENDIPMLYFPSQTRFIEHEHNDAQRPV